MKGEKVSIRVGAVLKGVSLKEILGNSSRNREVPLEFFKYGGRSPHGGPKGSSS